MLKFIFPIPIFEAICNLDLKAIIKQLENEKIYEVKNGNDFKNQYGIRSEDTYLLEKASYMSLKGWIEIQLKKYAIESLGYNIENIKITQSWISIKHPGQGHQVHNHPNSFISGVFYWQENIESMYFKRPNDYSLFQVDRIENLNFNEYEEFKPSKLSLVLFPSYLEHFVGVNHSNSSRYCLPFNTMVTGKVGNNNLLNELVLK